MTIPNVESLFLPNSAMDTDTTDALNNFQMEDLIGKRITRRQTLSKYVQVGSGTAPTNNFQLPKATYVIDRISAKTSIAVELGPDASAEAVQARMEEHIIFANDAVKEPVVPISVPPSMSKSLCTITVPVPLG